MSFDRGALEALLPKNRLKSVGHYTKIGTLPFLLREPGTALGKEWNSARATGVRFLNDRQEFVLGHKEFVQAAKLRTVSPGIQTEINNLVGMASGSGQDVYSISFSGACDELGQWRGYADGGFGCCVVTDTQDVHKAADVAGWTFYKPSDRRKFANEVIDLLAGLSDPVAIRKTLQAAASFMKHEGFQPEKEFRLLVFEEKRKIEFRESTQRVVPFTDVLSDNQLELPVKKVVVGPGWQISSLSPGAQLGHHVISGIQRLLMARCRIWDVVPSKIPFDPR